MLCLVYVAVPRPDRVATAAEIVSAGRLDKWHDQTVVLVFAGLECPVANGYVPEVRQLEKAFRKHDIHWIAVHSDMGVTQASAAEHAKEYGLEFPIILDSQQQLATQVGAKVLGQVVVMQRGQVVYRGRINDRFDARTGKRRAAPTTHELHDVLTALGHGKDVPFTETSAYGCPIPFKK